MAWTAPTPADVKARWVRFAPVADATIQRALDASTRLVDHTWQDDDRTEGMMLYAAHDLTLDGQGGGTEAQLNAEGVGDFQSIKLGSLSLTRFGRDASSKSGSATLDVFNSTTFGQRFLALASRFLGGGLSTGDASALAGGVSPYARDVPYLPGLGSVWPGNG